MRPVPAPVAVGEATRRAGASRCRPGITFLDDDAIAGVAPRSEWHHVTGTAGTTVYADTGRLVHRLMRPTDRDRYSVTFVYTSDQPYVVYSRVHAATVLRGCRRSRFDTRGSAGHCPSRPGSATSR